MRRRVEHMEPRTLPQIFICPRCGRESIVITEGSAGEFVKANCGRCGLCVILPHGGTALEPVDYYSKFLDMWRAESEKAKANRSVVPPSKLLSTPKGDAANLPNADFQNSIGTKKEEEYAKDLVQCPHCISRVTKDRLGRHVERVHSSGSKSTSASYSYGTKSALSLRLHPDHGMCSCGASISRIPIPDMRDGSRGVICICTNCGHRWREG